MKKPLAKRLPHGVTLALVMDKLLFLSTRGTNLSTVSRQQLLDGLAPMTGTTIDDRLRVLVQQGRVKRCGHGLYLPHIPITIPARPRRVIPAESPGTRTITQDDAGNPVLIRWLKPGESPW